MTESDYPYTAFVGTKWPNTFWRILQTTQRRCPLHTVFSLILCLFIKEDKCTYKPELAAAFVKNVVNITAVGHLWKQWFLGLSVGRMELKKTKHILLLQYDEKGMEDAVGTRNPVSLAFEVTSDFMHYSSGVYSRWEDVAGMFRFWMCRLEKLKLLSQAR